jgi:hypothetical protein
MKAALRGSYVDFVCFMGITEKYPLWFEEELYECVYMDDSRYTFWTPDGERKPDYYEKQLVEDYTVFLRKPNGEVHVTDYEVVQYLYITFQYDITTNSGIMALQDDCIDYVECIGGVLSAEYPNWFYEYFTEAVHFPRNGESILVYENGEYSVDNHCVFLKNRFGEIKGMYYDDFLKYYDPCPKVGGIWYDV